MTGNEFYSLAQRLSAGDSPAELRSAISRAYYGAFHNALELLKSIGITLHGGAECHKHVRYILDQCEDEDLLKANSKLGNLRLARNDADYELSDKRFDKKPCAILNLKIADEIIECIKAKRPGDRLSPMHDKLRSYAKDTLKVSVV